MNLRWLFGNFGGSAFTEHMAGRLAERGAIDEAADAGYNLAMDMCGNDGQVSVIDMTGYDAFYECAESAAEANRGDGYEILLSACPYPEAVTEILFEAAIAIFDIVNETASEIYEGDMEKLGEDEDEVEFD